MTRIFSYFIPPEWQNHKISEFLRAQGYSAHILKHLRNTGDFVTGNFIAGDPIVGNSIKQNSNFVHMNARLSAGDKLVVTLAEEASEKVIPTNLPLHIVYEDEDILVINKPAGMPSHPSRGIPETTLGNAVAYYYASKGEEIVYRCINRLDKNTSGLTIIAKNALSGAILYEEQLSRRIHRTYTAITTGFLTPADGTIDLPIARVSEDSVLRTVDFEHGKRAVTHYKVMIYFTVNSKEESSKSDFAMKYEPGSRPEAKYEPCTYSLVECRLETGRTHQIRVHMKALGHPLVGDHLYLPETESNSVLTRQALHAGSLDFIHPITKEPLHFEAALPKDMQDFFTLLSPI